MPKPRSSIRHLHKSKPDTNIRSRKALLIKIKFKTFIKNKIFLKLPLDKLVWKTLNNPKISSVFVACLTRIPFRIRSKILIRLSPFYSFCCFIFFKYMQSEKAYRVARLIKIIFKDRLSNHASREAHIYALYCLRSYNPEHLCRQYENVEFIFDPTLAYYLSTAQLLCADYVAAKKYIQQALEMDGKNVEILRIAGTIEVLLGNKLKGEEYFRKRIAMDSDLFIPHQNQAAHTERYLSQKTVIKDLSEVGSLHIYDQLNYIGESLFISGKLADSLFAYKQALLHQKKIRENFSLPTFVIKQLETYSNFHKDRPIALLPLEWVTQIGHIGLLDIFLKLEKLERKREWNYVLLAPKSMVANLHYLTYWKNYFCVIEDDKLIQALIPYQRQLGEGFIPYLNQDESMEPWTRAGARAQYQWQNDGRPPQLTLTESDRIFGQAALKSMGLPENVWFAALHIREASYYNEVKGGTGDHRNSSFSHYIRAIEEITNRGGWVIRMGDAKMTPLPKMKNVIDYARSIHKSARMDIFLVATARFFIGTTSGLTTAALSFDTPALLVNTISNDWQLWTKKTHFIPKMIYDPKSKRRLTLPEIYLTENRDLLFHKELIQNKKWQILNNDSDDIHAAVRYKLDVLDNKASLSQIQKDLLDAYHTQMSREPYMFGAGQIVPNFLERHPYLISSV